MHQRRAVDPSRLGSTVLASLMVSILFWGFQPLDLGSDDFCFLERAVQGVPHLRAADAVQEVGLDDAGEAECW